MSEPGRSARVAGLTLPVHPGPSTLPRPPSQGALPRQSHPSSPANPPQAGASRPTVAASPGHVARGASPGSAAPAIPPSPTQAAGTLSGDWCDRSRPQTVTLVALALVTSGAVGLVGVWVVLSLLDAGTRPGLSRTGWAMLGAQLLLSAAQLGSAVLVWQGRRAARRVALAACLVNLVGTLVAPGSGGLQAAGGALVHLALVGGLRHPHVVAWCR